MDETGQTVITDDPGATTPDIPADVPDVPSDVPVDAFDPSVLPDPVNDPIVYDIKKDVLGALNDFYAAHVKVHVEGSIQVFHSLTLGEAAIAILLAAILLVLIFKWIWEVVRYA